VGVTTVGEKISLAFPTTPTKPLSTTRTLAVSCGSVSWGHTGAEGERPVVSSLTAMERMAV
jgi:hypothetical protein